jgi:hypothetical protein
MKLQILLTVALFITIKSLSQTTPVPDPAFEAKLISLGIDTNGMNGNILNSDAEGVTNLNVSNSGISNLAGIEAFVDLLMLDCEDNTISTLDLSFNTMLTFLDCNNNTLSSLNINANTDLISLNASDNSLTNINLANNLALSDITLQNNQLTDLDLANNSNLYQIVAHDNSLTSITFPASPTLLEIVWIYNNSLTNIDLTTAPTLATLRFENNDLVFLDLRNGNNTNINTMDARDNPNLQLICVDDVVFASNATNWNKDATAEYSETCILGNYDNSNFDVVIAPNPATNSFNIQLNTNTEIETLEWINLAGQKQSLAVAETVDVSTFASGIYFLKITLRDGRQHTHKIIRK